MYAPKEDDWPALGTGEPEQRAERRLAWLVERAGGGDPVLLSYKTAYQRLVGEVPVRWSMS